MREQLEHDLQTILNGTGDMLDLIRSLLKVSGTALLEHRPELLEEARELDLKVDAMEHTLEEECLRIIARYQPVASDLRFVASILKSITDLERMGDYAVHVAEDAADLSRENPLKKYVNLGNMLRRADEMLVTVKAAVIERNLEKAELARSMDDEIDELYEQVQRELVTYMIEDPRTISRAMLLMRVGRSIERFGDHIENVAERVAYWVSGERHYQS